MHKIRRVFGLYQATIWVYNRRKISRCDIKEGIRLRPDIHISRSHSSESITLFQTQNVFCSYILSFHFSFQDIILSGLSLFLQTCYLQVREAFSTACLWQETKLFASPLSKGMQIKEHTNYICSHVRKGLSSSQAVQWILLRDMNQQVVVQTAWPPKQSESVLFISKHWPWT